MKVKENGLKDYGYIDLKEETDAAVTLTPEQELGQELFCVSWGSILKYLLYLKDKIKNPIWKVLLGAGLSLIDGLHSQMCEQK